VTGTSASGLRVGCWSFTATDSLPANDAEIRRGIVAAAAAGVRILLTPECCLPGYPGAVRANLNDLDGCATAEREDSLLQFANQHGITLVLGTAASTGSGGWTNDAATSTARYRKRCLTPGDEACFVAGDQPTVITVDGWRCGLAICYDLRFADIWADLHRQEVDALLVIAHMAGPDPDPGTKSAVIPSFCAVRAAEAATPLVFCNTSADDRWLDSGMWDARGMRGPTQAAGLLICELAPRANLAPWYVALRRNYLARL
jgi:predicted amidohydrolase